MIYIQTTPLVRPSARTVAGAHPLPFYLFWTSLLLGLFLLCTSLPAHATDPTEQTGESITYDNEPLKGAPEDSGWNTVKLHKKMSSLEGLVNEDEPATKKRAVRLTVLPGRSIVPLPAGAATPSNQVNATPRLAPPEEAPTAPRPAPLLAKTEAETKPKAAAPEPDPAKAEACAAITAYKKNQLSAIESDTHTMNELQRAIKELGLVGKLNIDPTTGVLKTTASVMDKTTARN